MKGKHYHKVESDGSHRGNSYLWDFYHTLNAQELQLATGNKNYYSGVWGT